MRELINKNELQLCTTLTAGNVLGHLEFEVKSSILKLIQCSYTNNIFRVSN